jgi:hypothetical protein
MEENKGGRRARSHQRCSRYDILALQLDAQRDLAAVAPLLLRPQRDDDIVPREGSVPRLVAIDKDVHAGHRAHNKRLRTIRGVDANATSTKATVLHGTQPSHARAQTATATATATATIASTARTTTKQ